MILKQNGIWGEIMYENVEYDQHFIGEFDVEGDSFNGELIFNKKNGGILIHLTKDVTIESAFRYHYGKVAVIIGKLNAGIVVTLFNNRCVKNHTNNFKLLTLNFVSDYFVWSDKERRDTLYNKMVSILGNAYKWSGFSAFESVPGGVKIVDTLPQKTYNWFGVKITFSRCLNNYILLPFKEEETKIIQRLSVTIESSCKMPLDEFIKIRNRVTSLISFAIKDNVNVDDEYLIDFDDSYTIGLKKAGYTEYSKHYLFTSSPILDTFSTYIHEYNFRMNQLPEDDTLNVKLDKLKPIFNLYLSLFVHPVVGCKLGAVGGLSVGVGAVVAVVGPHHGLHPGAQLAVVAVQVHTDELAKAAHVAAAAQVHGKTLGSFLGGFCHAGAGAGVRGREGVAIAVFSCVFQAVGALIHRSRQGVGSQFIFRVAAHQLTAVFHDGVLGAEICKVAGGHAHRHILGAQHLVVIHLHGRAVCLSDGAPIPAYGGAVGQIDGLAIVRPVRNGVGAAVLGVDDSSALEAATMQTVVDGSAGNGIKCAKVMLLVAVQLRRDGSAAGSIDLLVCPILIPGQGSVEVGVFFAEQEVQKAVFLLGGGCCKGGSGQQTERHGRRQQQGKKFLCSHKKCSFHRKGRESLPYS